MAQKKEYAASQKVLEAEAAVEQQQGQKPQAYQSAYDDALKQVMDRILNREDFRYNLAGDALYRQYRNQAERSGRLAMEDTMGKAAALTGGYGNSYAQSVGQQAYNQELDRLADRIPELYNLAMSQYQLQSQGLQQKYDLLSGARQQEYQQYQDGLAAWQKEADQLWQRYTDARDTDYSTYRDEVTDWKWQQEFDEDRRRYDQEWIAEHPNLWMISGGQIPVAPGTSVSSGASVSSGGSSSTGKTSQKTQQTEQSQKTSFLKPLLTVLGGILVGSRLTKELIK